MYINYMIQVAVDLLETKACMYVTCLNSLHVLYALFAKFILSSYSRNMILKIDDQ